MKKQMKKQMKKMSTDEMYAVWWQDDKNYLMCYCVDKDGAETIVENMGDGWDLVIVPPGKTIEEVLAE